MKVIALVAAAALIVGVAVVLVAIQQPSGSQSVELVLDRRVVKDVRTLTYTVINGGQQRVSFGEIYDIQYGIYELQYSVMVVRWVSVDWLKDAVWPQILYTLEPGESFSRQIEIPKDAPAGPYRLVKKVYVDDVEKELTAEFEVG